MIRVQYSGSVLWITEICGLEISCYTNCLRLFTKRNSNGFLRYSFSKESKKRLLDSETIIIYLLIN